ncbi:hypothetical protein [Paenibacillus tyrfis]|uniref:hypothetical protein n=1 Tax=Paenibacillus tyrfis TaxID=1501230 RepID=UPI000B596D6F|nr:hypothetical protein [Paenibacillus tyrfis]
MSKVLIDEARRLVQQLKEEHMHVEADVVSSLLQDVESEYRRSSEHSNLKKGDAVVMHTCMEARNPKYAGRVWTCKSDAFRPKGHDYDSIFLEGFSGSFSAEYLVKVSLPNMEALQKKIALLEESLSTYKLENEKYERSTYIDDFLFELRVDEKGEIPILIKVHGIEHTLGINKKTVENFKHLFWMKAVSADA